MQHLGQPLLREEDPGRVAQGFVDRAGPKLKTFGHSLCPAGAARKRREVTLSFLLALKLRTGRAGSASPAIPSATATASQRRSRGGRRAAEPGSPLASPSSAPLLHNPRSSLLSSLTKRGFK